MNRSQTVTQSASNDAPAAAKLFTFNDRNDTTIVGSLEAETEVALHAFTAPMTGSLFISPDIGTHAMVSLLDADQHPLLTVGSFFLAHPVEAGRKYFIRVSMAVGTYAVSLSARP